jgi:hypothetical protein
VSAGSTQLDAILDLGDFAANLDRQQSALSIVLAAAGEGGPTALHSQWATDMIGKIAARLDESPERIRGILEMRDPILVRRALKQRTSAKVKRLPHEKVFPKEGWLGAYLDSNLLTEVPLAWHFWSAVSVLGSVARRSIYIDTGYHEVLFPNEFVFLVGPTGHGKSQAIDRASHILDSANKLTLMQCLKRGVDSRVTITNVVTAQSLHDKMKPGAVHPAEAPGATIQRRESTVLVVNDEASTILGSGRKEVSKQLVPTLTDAYGGKARDTATRGQGEVNTAPVSLSLLLGSTAEWIRTNMEESVLHGGFTGRCVFVERHKRDRLQHRDIPLGAGPDPVVEHELAKMLVPWLLCTPIELTLTEEALDWYGPWYVTHRDNKGAPCPSPGLNPYWERKPAHVLKLAAILTLSEAIEAGQTPEHLDVTMSLPLGLEALDLARRLLEAEEGRTAQLLEEINQSSDQETLTYIHARLVKMWKASGDPPQPVPHSEWYRSVRTRVGRSDRFRALVASLVEGGDVAAKVSPGNRGTGYTPTRF